MRRIQEWRGLSQVSIQEEEASSAGCYHAFVTPTLLQVQNLDVAFPVRSGDRTDFISAVRDLNFEIGAGESLGLVGESGSGKSVTSLAILRLLPPQARITGTIRFEERDLLRLPKTICASCADRPSR